MRLRLVSAMAEFRPQVVVPMGNTRDDAALGAPSSDDARDPLRYCRRNPVLSCSFVGTSYW